MSTGTGTTTMSTQTSVGPGGSSSAATSLDSTDGSESGSTSAMGTSGDGETDGGSSTGDGGNGCPQIGFGDACADATQCACPDNACYVVGPLGGVCSECDEDTDCAATTGFGCNFPNPLLGTAAVCSATGDLGEGCETSDACAAGLSCTTLIDVPGILSNSTCSECETDADCPGQQCAPTYDIDNFAGHSRCVDAGSVPDDEGCDLAGDGSECISAQCAPASLMGIPFIGVCAPCNEDLDCPDQTCMFPEISMEGTSLGILPGLCL